MSVTREIFRVLLEAKAPLTVNTLMECLPGDIERPLVQALLGQRCKAGELVRSMDDGKPAYAIAPGYDASRRQERKSKSMPAADRQTNYAAQPERQRIDLACPVALYQGKPPTSAHADARANTRETPVEISTGASVVVLGSDREFQAPTTMVEGIARCAHLAAAWMAEGLLLGAPREVLLHLAAAHQGLEAVQTLLMREGCSHG